MHGEYYVICINGYKVNGKEFHTGQIQWKPKEQRPIQNSDWRKATEKEIQNWLKKTNSIDMRSVKNKNYYEEN